LKNEGAKARSRQGQTVSVHYTGKLTNGTKFDSSLDRGQPIEFVLGAGMSSRVDQGIDGMKVGGKRKLTIPPELAYGAAERPRPHPAQRDARVRRRARRRQVGRARPRRRASRPREGAASKLSAGPRSFRGSFSAAGLFRVFG